MLQQTCESLDKEQIPKGILKMSNIYIKGTSCLKYNSKVQVKMPKVNKVLVSRSFMWPIRPCVWPIPGVPILGKKSKMSTKF